MLQLYFNISGLAIYGYPSCAGHAGNRLPENEWNKISGSLDWEWDWALACFDILLQSSEQFGLAAHSGAEFGHHHAGGGIGDVHGLAQIQPSGQAEAHGGDDGVSRARYVEHFLRAGGLVADVLCLIQAHAFFAAGEQDGV